MVLSSIDKGLVHLIKKAICRKKYSAQLQSYSFAADILNIWK